LRNWSGTAAKRRDRDLMQKRARSRRSPRAMETEYALGL
jgi:hypothetical protein